MNKRLFLFIIIALAAACGPAAKEPLAILPIQTPAGRSSAQPYLFVSDNDTYLSWIEKQDKHSEFKFSKLVENSWSSPVLIDSGNTRVVNWADYPVVASTGRNFFAHYLERTGSKQSAYDIKLISSGDGGTSWSQPTTLHDDGKEAEHGFVSMVPFGSNFMVTWLDGRNTVMEGMEHHDGHHGEMTLRAALLDSKGTKLNEWELDGRTCDCCQTGAAVTSNGPIVVYRDRSDDEIRDMSIVRYSNGSWTAPKSIFDDKWKIRGCPVNGPRVDAKGNNVVIAWFSMPDEDAQVNVIFSRDGGETFGKRLRIDEGKTIGRVDVVLLEDGNAFVIWMEGASIYGARVTSDGKQSSTLVASSSGARSSGFPQVARAGNRLIFAWTDDKENVVKTATANL